MEEQDQKSQPAADIGALVRVTTVFDSKNYIDTIKRTIKEGEADPLAVYTVLKRMNKVAEEIFEDKEIREIVLNEADKHLSGNKKSFNLYSAQICKGAVYTFYDFTGCNHVVLDELYKIQEQVKMHIKLIEDELKLLIPDEKKLTLGIVGDTKTVAIDRVPVLTWPETQDNITVQAPKKIQKIGLKYMKV